MRGVCCWCDTVGGQALGYIYTYVTVRDVLVRSTSTSVTLLLTVRLCLAVVVGPYPYPSLGRQAPLD